MEYLILVFAVFAVLGVIDAIFGNRFGLGAEFEKGIQLAGTLTLAMLGMLCLIPVLSKLLSPVILPAAEFLHLDPSVFSAMLIANDMGGAPLSAELAADKQMGLYNGLVTGSMMGVAVSFTIPAALKMIPKERHADSMLGILCGVCTIPVGCIAGGLAAGLPVLPLLINCIPVALFAAVIALGLIKAPDLSVKLLTYFGKGIYALIMVGLGLGLFQYLTGISILEGISPAEEHFAMLFHLTFLLSGVFPFIKVLSTVLKKPLAALSKVIGINDIASLGLLTTLASSTPTFGLVEKMDRRGTVLNMAFTVSAAFVLGDHLAFTVMFDASFAPAMIAGKFAAGIAALIVAHFAVKRNA